MAPVVAHAQGEDAEMSAGQDGEEGAAGTQGGSEARWIGDSGRKDHVGAGRNGKRLAAAGGGRLSCLLRTFALQLVSAARTVEGERSSEYQDDTSKLPFLTVRR